MCDNTSTAKLSKNQNYSPRTKHIIVHCGYVNQNIELGKIIINYYASRKKQADALTNTVSKIKLSKFVDDLELKSTSQKKKK